MIVSLIKFLLVNLLLISMLPVGIAWLMASANFWQQSLGSKLLVATVPAIYAILFYTIITW